MKRTATTLRSLLVSFAAPTGAWVSPVIALLFVCVIGTALAVIYSAYEYRRLFNGHQVQLQQRDQLQVEWGQLLLEQSALAALAEIEQKVRLRLDMYAPAPEDIVVVRP